MAKVLEWLKSKTADLIDPGYKERWDAQVDHVERALFKKKHAFDMSQEATAIGANPEQVLAIGREVYQRALTRVWQDGRVAPDEQKALAGIAALLRLKPDVARQIDLEHGVAQFRRALADVFADGRVDPSEKKRLEEIAASLQLSVRELIVRFFAKEGEAFLRSVFTSMTQDGILDLSEWKTLLHGAESLGLAQEDLVRMIRPQAEQFVEHVLADAKMDHRLSSEEQSTIDWLLANLTTSAQFRSYVQSHLNWLSRLTAIAAGKLPSIDMQFEGRRSGEIVHYSGPVTYVRLRERAAGPSHEMHVGQLVITDNRVIFTSPVKTLVATHHKVVAMVDRDDGFELRTSTKGSGNYIFPEDAELPRAIMRTAVGRANQTIVESKGDAPSRFIPRDVRQRVWQRYGGRCADCGATQYLEFDHIVPVARGGSNSDLNVQLLCRGCNAKKSDSI